MAARTLDSRAELQTAARGILERQGGPTPADVDLAQVYALAAWYVRACATYDEFQQGLNRMRVRQLATHLKSKEGWSAVDLERVGTLLPKVDPR